MSEIHGVVTGHVVKVEDDQGEGRVQVRISRLPGKNEIYPAPIATVMAGGTRGTWFMPEEGDEVLLAFDQNNVNHPYIIGFLWNGEQRPPETDRHKRVIKSFNGHTIALYDRPDKPQGDTGFIEISDANGNTIRMENGGMTIRSHGTLQIQAPNVIINGRPVVVAPKPI